MEPSCFLIFLCNATKGGVNRFMQLVTLKEKHYFINYPDLEPYFQESSKFGTYPEYFHVVAKSFLHTHHSTWKFFVSYFLMQDTCICWKGHSNSWHIGGGGRKTGCIKNCWMCLPMIYLLAASKTTNPFPLQQQQVSKLQIQRTHLHITLHMWPSRQFQLLIPKWNSFVLFCCSLQKYWHDYTPSPPFWLVKQIIIQESKQKEMLFIIQHSPWLVLVWPKE